MEVLLTCVADYPCRAMPPASRLASNTPCAEVQPRGVEEDCTSTVAKMPTIKPASSGTATSSGESYQQLRLARKNRHNSRPWPVMGLSVIVKSSPAPLPLSTRKELPIMSRPIRKK